MYVSSLALPALRAVLTLVLSHRGVAGGAVFPPIQGAIADLKATNFSYLIPGIGFAVIVPCTSLLLPSR
jgi:fucose permease